MVDLCDCPGELQRGPSIELVQADDGSMPNDGIGLVGVVVVVALAIVYLAGTDARRRGGRREQACLPSMGFIRDLRPGQSEMVFTPGWELGQIDKLGGKEGSSRA